MDSEMKTAITDKGAEEGIKFHTNILQYINANDINSLVKETNELFDTIMKDLEEVNN